MSERQERKPIVPKIECPYCHAWVSKVRDGRPDLRGGYKRKRRCENCRRVFFTIERAA